MRIAGFLLLTLVCGVPLMAAPSLKQVDDEALVNTSFPRELVDERRLRFSAHERADLDGSGTKNYLVVVYGNGILGRVRVLRENGDSMEVADETNFRFMRGFLPTLRLVDIDGDGIPEIIATFNAMGGEGTWPFRWTHGKLALICPAGKPAADQLAPFNHLEFEDVDGDGHLEIIHSPLSADPRPEVLKLSDDGLSTKKAGRIVASRRFAKETDEAESDYLTFRAAAGAQLVLTVVNGDVHDQRRAVKGELLLNGTPLLLRSGINEGTKTFQVPIVAGDFTKNVLELQFEGAAAAEVTLSIAAQQ
jgi:hypothetical protein